MGLPKGRTNNPNGRPKKGFALADLLRARLDEPASADDPRPLKLALIDKLATAALSDEGDWFSVIRFIFERLEGEVGGETKLVITADDLVAARRELREWDERNTGS